MPDDVRDVLVNEPRFYSCDASTPDRTGDAISGNGGPVTIPSAMILGLIDILKMAGFSAFDSRALNGLDIPFGCFDHYRLQITRPKQDYFKHATRGHPPASGSSGFSVPLETQRASRGGRCVEPLCALSPAGVSSQNLS